MIDNSTLCRIVHATHKDAMARQLELKHTGGGVKSVKTETQRVHDERHNLVGWRLVEVA